MGDEERSRHKGKKDRKGRESENTGEEERWEMGGGVGIRERRREEGAREGGGSQRGEGGGSGRERKRNPEL